MFLNKIILRSVINFIKRIIHYGQQNKIITVILLFYIFTIISVIKWGIPNQNHPFNYHMDEWHQMQSIRALFKEGSPNVSGAAHGTIFQFFLSGFYLGFLTIFGVINPFTVTSSVTQLDVQEKLFILLRFNTIIFGTLSLLFLGIIARKYFNVNSALALILFIITPLWLSLSNYFKYDIALVFWIFISYYFIYKFGATPSKKNYLLAGFFCSLAVATKISAIPLLIIYVISFFYYMGRNSKRQLSWLFAGVLVFFATFLIFGIPDLLLQKGDYREFLYSNLIADPQQSENLILNHNSLLEYMLFTIAPLNFGYPFFVIYFIVIFFWIKQILVNKYKNQTFLLISFFIFVGSLVPLKMGANGNRLLVLLPFLSLLSSSFLTIMWKRFNSYSKKIFILIFIAVVVLQALQSFPNVFIKWNKDVRETSSVWIDKNLTKGEEIGLEDIPIYQFLPDIIVKEFYLRQYFPKTHTGYNYVIINESNITLPNIIIITNRRLYADYQKKSQKKLLLDRLKKENYKILVEFNPPDILYKIYGNELNMRISGLVPIPEITIYRKI